MGRKGLQGAIFCNLGKEDRHGKNWCDVGGKEETGKNYTCQYKDRTLNAIIHVIKFNGLLA